MNIAIYTLVGHTNYGGILQAYAMQKILEDMGHSVTILNRQPDLPPFYLCCVRILILIKRIVHKYVFRNKSVVVVSPFTCDFTLPYDKIVDYSEIKNFLKKHLKLSRICTSTTDLKKLCKIKNYDVYIVGSDQVWREAYVPNIYESFLDFLPNGNESIKLAYAASIGGAESPIDINKIPRCKELLNRFTAISVREFDTMTFINKEFKTDCIITLDPTLLLDRSQYKGLFNSIGKNSSVVSYILDPNFDKAGIINDLLCNTDRNHVELMPIDSTWRYSVEDWLAYIYTSEIVITDSFHGCVFAIIFNRPFVAIANCSRGVSRFRTLLSKLDLEDRLIFNYEEYISKKHILMQDINYDKVNELLKKEREISLSYLYRTLF